MQQRLYPISLPDDFWCIIKQIWFSGWTLIVEALMSNRMVVPEESRLVQFVLQEGSKTKPKTFYVYYIRIVEDTSIPYVSEEIYPEMYRHTSELCPKTLSVDCLWIGQLFEELFAMIEKCCSRFLDHDVLLLARP